MRRLGRFIPVVLALLAGSCSRLNEGVVVEKSAGVNNYGYAGLGPSFSIDVAGRDAGGKVVTRSALLSQREWLDIKIGDRFSFNKRGILNQPEAERIPAPTPPPKAKLQSAPKQKSSRPAPTPVPLSSPAPAPGFPNLLSRLFHRNTAPPQPVPAPAAPKKKRVRKSSQKSKPRKTAVAAPKTTQTTAPSVVVTATPAPSPASPTPTPGPAPNLTITPEPAPAPKVSEAQYRAVQAKALEDPAVRAAKQKIHAATNDEEQRRAMDEYQRTLLDKMRALDSSLGPRLDKEEAEKPGPSPKASPTP